jgi:PleD family two-component response regulator
MLLLRTVAAPMQPGTQSSDMRPTVAFGQDRSILLVDDDPDVRDATAALLIKSGYDLVQAADGAAALATLSDAGARIRFVIAD